MRRAARLGAGRLLSALQPQLAAGGCLGGALPLPAAACTSQTLFTPAAACRAAWPSGSVQPRALTTTRTFATASTGDDGPLKQFRLAQTGEGIKECELVQWFVAEGDAVEEFGLVCEVQSDKATIEITSPFAGVVSKLHHKTGDVVQVGDVLADIHSSGGQDLELHSPPPASHEPGAVAAAQHTEEHAPGTGRREALHPSTSGSIGEDEVADRVLTSPVVRRLAKEHGISLGQVGGTGPDGRVTKADVLAYLDALSAAGPGTISEDVAHDVPTTEEATVRGIPEEAAHVAQPTAHHPAAAAAAAAAAEPTVVPLRGYRKAMVKTMTAAGQVPHFHLCDEVQMDALLELRQRLKGEPSLNGAKLTFLPFFIKAASLAMREFPLINASLSHDQSSVLLHSRVNVGVAMATPHGLAVPNIKDVQAKSVAQLAAELNRLQEKALANKLSREDTSGGTFTLSNIGTIGGTYATPLVSPPEVAILAVGRVQRVPRFSEDGLTVVPSNIMNMSLGADHRVVDGATAAGFAKTWRHYVESPGTLLLHLQ